MASKASLTHLDSVARPLSALRVRITLIVEFKMEDLSVAADIAGAVKGALEKLEEIGEVTRHDQEFLTAMANA
jgi:hypothetical protein